MPASRHHPTRDHEIQKVQPWKNKCDAVYLNSCLSLLALSSWDWELGCVCTWISYPSFFPFPVDKIDTEEIPRRMLLFSIFQDRTKRAFWLFVFRGERYFYFLAHSSVRLFFVALTGWLVCLVRLKGDSSDLGVYCFNWNLFDRHRSWSRSFNLIKPLSSVLCWWTDLGSVSPPSTIYHQPAESYVNAETLKKS